MKVVLPTFFKLGKANEVFLLEKYALTMSSERLVIELNSTVQVRVMIDPLGQIGFGLSLIKVTEVGAGTGDHIISM